jgi:hypothetical protein
LYNSKDEAKIGYNSEGFTIGSSFFDGSIQLCHIIIKGNCTNLSDTDRAEIITEGKFSGTSGGAGGGLGTLQIYGEMYAYENATAIVIGQANVYHAIAYSGIITGIVNKTTFTAGVVGAIASVSDYSATVAGTILVTVTAGHNLTSGDIIAIHSTTNYNGVYVVTVVSPTTFYITKAYVSSQTGTYARGARLKINEGGAGTYKVHFNCTAFTAANAVNIKMEVNKNTTALDNIASSRKYSNQNDYGQMTAGGFVTVSENDVIWMSVRNESGATNITIRHFNMNILKIS